MINMRIQQSRYRIICVLILLFTSCLKEKKTTNINNDVIEKVDYNSQKVVVKCVSDDENVFNFLVPLNPTYSFGKNHKDTKKEVNQDTMIMVLDSISQPLIMETMSWGNDEHFYYTDILYVPGDTVFYEIKDHKIVFKGKNAAINNFLYEINNYSNLEYGRNPYKGNIEDYKNRVDSINNERNKLFENYIDDYNVTSNSEIKIVKDYLKFTYLYNLICPRYEKVGGWEGAYYNSLDGLKTFIEQEYVNKETVFNSNKYLNNTIIEDFKEPNSLYIPRYKNTLNAFISHYFETSNHPDYSREKLIAEKEYIETNLEGEIHDYAITRMLYDYNLHGFGHSIQNVDFMKNILDEYEVKVSKKDYREKIKEMKEDLSSFDYKLSDRALDSKLINKFGDTLTLREIFGRSDKRTRVLNFWASWCGPCISEIQTTKSFKDKLIVEDNVEWIYLSIDENKSKWLDMSKELSEYLTVRNQYFLLNGTNSSLAKFLKITAIPRYVILNKNNQIVLRSAPHPSDSLNFKRIINEVK